jgi:hypothetical protein
LLGIKVWKIFNISSTTFSIDDGKWSLGDRVSSSPHLTMMNEEATSHGCRFSIAILSRPTGSESD